jgi:hypothetical protein
LIIVIVQLEVFFFLLFLTTQSGVLWRLVLFTEERCYSLDLGISTSCKIIQVMVLQCTYGQGIVVS